MTLLFNERLRELRISQGISQVELAKKLGVTKQSVSNWENDNIQPSIEMLIKIAVCLGVSTDYLLGLKSDQTIDVSALSPEIAGHIRRLVVDLSKKTEK